MVPLIMAIASMAAKKGQAENQALQNQADALRNTQIQMPQQQGPSFQLPNKQPSINSVFGNY